MAKYRLGCCVPGASFMPEGEAGIKANALDILRRGCETIIDAGFDYAEAGVGMIMELTPDELERVVREKLPLEAANSFIPPTYGIVSGVRADGMPPLNDYVREAMRRMSMLGIGVVVFGSGAARRIPDGMSLKEGRGFIGGFLRMCARHGEKYGVTVAIEPLRASECNAINLTSEGAELAALERRICEEGGDPEKGERISYLADAFHMCHGGEPADALTRADVLPVHIHVSEPPDRTYPGSHGGEYLAAFADAIKKTAYSGRVSVECGFSDFEREVGLAYEFVSKLF